MLREVVLIDDSEPDLLYGRLMLERHGGVGRVHAFDSAQDALRFLAGPDGRGIELILLDINMPGMDGFAFLQAYEAARRCGGSPPVSAGTGAARPATAALTAAHAPIEPTAPGPAPVVVLSSSPDPVDQQRAGRHASVVGYLTKPIDAASVRGLDAYCRR